MLAPFQAAPSERCKQLLEKWAVGMHVILDAPVLAIALLVQNHLDQPWDLISKATVCLSSASLLINLPWNISKTRLSAAYIRADGYTRSAD